MSKGKYYILDMFPYPSGEGLHMGHVKIFTASDIYSRYKRMLGYDVLHPTGFDAFGLPAEQYAIKNKVNPAISTKSNCNNFLRQMKMMNWSYDYDKTISTTDPEFYKWTQWIFKQLYKKDLAWQSNEPINWCPSCKTGLANEDLEGNVCERCNSVVEKKPLRQWVLGITKYADRLVDDLDTLTDWQDWIKDLQRNWIGRSEGSEIDFEIVFPLTLEGGNKIQNTDLSIFTTRADTIFGATFMAINYNIAKKWIESGWQASSEILEIINKIENEEKNRSIDFDINKLEKIGIDTGIKAINPANNKEIPIYIANYILSDYGTGAIMAVPAHDERDYEFAKKYGLEITDVVCPYFVSENGEYIPNKDLPTKKVNGILAILFSKEKAKYLILNNSQGFYSFIQGTNNEGENIRDTVFREIREETGYILKDIKRITTPYKSIYCKFWKNINMEGLVHSFYAEIDSSENVDLLEDEKLKHNIEWWTEEEIQKFLNSLPANQDRHTKYVWCNFKLNKNIFTEDGILINSDQFNDMTSEEARQKITEYVGGKIVKKYKLKDWVFARQRYWGEPFPIVFETDQNGETNYNKPYMVSDNELPVRLPVVDNYEPTGTGESPLANIKDFTDVYGYINNENEFVSCDRGDSGAKLFKRETNTMPQWAGSSWYWLRFMDSHNDKEAFSSESAKKWGEVDVYIGGVEHATRHLIYGRFWHKFLYDLGIVDWIEPFKRLETVGLLMGSDGNKMSKRTGNIINPDDTVSEYGADITRLYVTFIGPFNQTGKWDNKAIVGIKRFVERIEKLKEKIGEPCQNQNIIHQTIKKAGEDIEDFRFNTAISQMMILLNEFESKGVSESEYKMFIQILWPFAPEICERLGKEMNIDKIWPTFDENKILEDNVNIAFQVNGKLRDTISVPINSEEDYIMNILKDRDSYKKYVTTEPKKIIFVKNKIVNVVG